MEATPRKQLRHSLRKTKGASGRKGKAFPHIRAAKPRVLLISVVRDFQPTLHFVIDILQSSYFETMCDAIFFCEATGVDQTLRRLLRVAQSQTKVDSRPGRRLDLSEHVIAIERHDRLTGTGFRVLTHCQSQLQQRLTDRP